MRRKRKTQFKLSPEWMFQEPIDFEYNKYTLLDYIQKCESSFDDYKIYPDFVEISLHLANVQSINRENTLLLTNKKFETCDDEILLKELHPKKIPNLNEDQSLELKKTLYYSNSKLMDVFSVGKSIWSIVYESTDIQHKKNKNYLHKGYGYLVYTRKPEKELYIWEYSIRKIKKSKDSKLHLESIFSGVTDGRTVNQIINESTNWKQDVYQSKLPVFEFQSRQHFPFEETLIPMAKRKLLSYILQSVPKEKLENFDNLKIVS
jgi:hypothetical protein